MDVALRDVREEDLDVLFEHQADPEANRMAAFAPADPTDRAAFDERWARILGDATSTTRAVTVDGEVAGYVAAFNHEGTRHVAYWLGRTYWGRGIGARALAAFADEIATRPLHARVAHDNVASRRVLEKCGFTVVGHDRGFANARGEETDELLLELR